ncbi:MAG: putative teichuronic acid biosynthesis glycosyltransferase TuaC [Chloroflexi bacterium ADurb.Bin360]|nr:MAG: putative teichuronic acid biosynthesis glycosyltransferase TuaC [Chloroflexi bacterium ADurb.Bin360]
MLTTSYPRHQEDFAGGFILSLVHTLLDHGIAVDVVTPHAPQALFYEDSADLRVHRFVYAWPLFLEQLAYGAGIPENIKRRPWLLLLIPFFMGAFLLRAWRVCALCDVIHVHWAPLGWLGLLLRWRYRLPLLISVHGSDVRSLPSAWVAPVLRRADAVITSALETERRVAQLGVPSEHCHAIPLPLDAARLRPGADVTTIAQQLGLSPDTPVVTFVGRLNEFKDPLTFVRAVPEVLADFPEARFVVVGDGPLSGALHDFVVTAGLQHVVYLPGARSDVGNYLALSSVFTALSPVENVWSMTIAEAMTAGVPCILTRAGCTEEVFTHEQDAYLIPMADSTALAIAIVRLLRDAELRANLVRGGYDLLWRHGRDNASIGQTYAALYTSLRQNGRENAR